MEKYEDLLKQAEYARFIDKTRALVCQNVASGKTTSVWIGGTKMVKLSADELGKYKAWKKEQAANKILAN